MQSSNRWLIFFIILLFISICCCMVFGGLAAIGWLNGIVESETSGEDISITEFTPLATAVSETPIVLDETPVVIDSTLLNGKYLDIEIPLNDPIDLARRLKGKSEIPTTVPAQSYQNGDKKNFWVTNTDTNNTFQIEATLKYTTEHVYFWVQDGVKAKQSDIVRLVDTFENEIYPKNKSHFGDEPFPGIDEDEHIYILYCSDAGYDIAGYFSSVDTLPPEAHQYSNAHEMFFLNADTTNLSDPFTYGVLAHEFQHMIHWNLDQNEDAWINEGLSELAAQINGYDPGGFDYQFSINPNLQLNYWPEEEDSIPYYGASFMFMSYFMDRFGEQAVRDLANNPLNGWFGINDVLQTLSENDVDNVPDSAEEFFAQWVLANYINNPAVGDGQYSYTSYQDFYRFRDSDWVYGTCSNASQTREVKQFGTEYIRLTCSDDVVLKFQGATEVQLLPTQIENGNYAVWSNRGDQSNMRMTRIFDLGNAQAPVLLTYKTWFEIEADYDYLYVEVSEDGENWTILETPSGTSADPAGNNYGWGYSGLSGGWIDEEVDLSEYAGEEIWLRFEYVTDGAVNGNGWLVDDITIPAIAYREDFENGVGGWELEGFVRSDNQLSQTFQVSLIRLGDEISVHRIELDQANRALIPHVLNNQSNDDVILVVSGTNRYTRQPARYSFQMIGMD